MMKSIKLFFLFAFILIAVASCKKDKTSGITGKWKLEKVKILFSDPLKEYDYSKSEITYQFKTNGILKISSDIEYYGKELGEYSYRVDSKTVTINNDSPYSYRIGG